jgi:hypothetical protein
MRSRRRRPGGRVPGRRGAARGPGHRLRLRAGMRRFGDFHISPRKTMPPRTAAFGCATSQKSPLTAATQPGVRAHIERTIFETATGNVVRRHYLLTRRCCCSLFERRRLLRSNGAKEISYIALRLISADWIMTRDQASVPLPRLGEIPQRRVTATTRSSGRRFIASPPPHRKPKGIIPTRPASRRRSVGRSCRLHDSSSTGAGRSGRWEKAPAVGRHPSARPTARHTF